MLAFHLYKSNYKRIFLTIEFVREAYIMYSFEILQLEKYMRMLILVLFSKENSRNKQLWVSHLHAVLVSSDHRFVQLHMKYWSFQIKSFM